MTAKKTMKNLHRKRNEEEARCDVSYTVTDRLWRLAVGEVLSTCVYMKQSLGLSLIVSDVGVCAQFSLEEM